MSDKTTALNRLNAKLDEAVRLSENLADDSRALLGSQRRGATGLLFAITCTCGPAALLAAWLLS